MSERIRRALDTSGRGRQGYLVRRHGSNDLDQLGKIRLHQRPALGSNNTLGSNCLSSSDRISVTFNYEKAKALERNRNKRLQPQGLSGSLK